VAPSAAIALTILVLTYVGVAAGRLPGLRINRAGFAFLGGAAMIAFGPMKLDEAFRAIELDTIAMLTGMSYPQFRIAHIFGHHRWAGTERDAATAKLGEGFYAFLARTLPSQWKEAWEFEQRRCSSRALSMLENRTLQDILAIILVYAGIIAGFGVRGALFFLFQSAVAIVVLELFNYIAHYGLVRGMRANGRLAPLSDACSWNTSNEFANLLLFNMGRHSDHHRRPAAAYPLLAGVSGAPELPLGYSGSILLALLPPLWRRVMDPCVFRLRSQPE